MVRLEPYTSECNRATFNVPDQLYTTTTLSNIVTHTSTNLQHWSYPFLHQEFKAFFLCFAVFVVITSGATLFEWEADEKKVRRTCCRFYSFLEIFYPLKVGGGGEFKKKQWSRVVIQSKIYNPAGDGLICILLQDSIFESLDY